ncbi:MAG: LysR family transcriptional regulator [Proteobacteria bacterium]|nr:LysR family transcriptional regulator [Pseudomonadota bacterium]
MELPTSHRSIETRHLRYFVVAAEFGSFRQAGGATGINESAISRRIRDLEDRIGASLFNRRSTGVSLTVAGHKFLPEARRILRNIDRSVSEIASVGRVEVGQLRIGIFSSMASGFLAELLRQYDLIHKNVQVEFIEGNPDEHIAAVRQLRIDVAFLTGTRNWRGCETMPLWSERVFGVLPEGHKLAGKHNLLWQDLDRETFMVSEVAPGPEIHDFLVQRLANLGHHPNIETQAVGRDNLLSLVATGRALTIVSEATVAAQFPGIAYRPIVGEILPFSAIWSHRNDNPALRRLLSMARNLSASILPSVFIILSLPL